jgi:hypothetical protein
MWRFITSGNGVEEVLCPVLYRFDQTISHSHFEYANMTIENARSDGNPISPYEIGKRYLHAKTLLPLTLRYIGPLPPSDDQSSSQIWYGIEYDDASKGKGHTGVYEGIQVFQSKQEGAGAFVKAGKRKGGDGDGVFVRGKTFTEAIEERYGSISPLALNTSAASQGDPSSTNSVGSTVVLGSSRNAIVVEAPGINAVQQRIGRLEKLRDIGLESNWVCGVGGYALRPILADRLRGV